MSAVLGRIDQVLDEYVTWNGGSDDSMVVRFSPRDYQTPDGRAIGFRQAMLLAHVSRARGFSLNASLIVMPAGHSGSCQPSEPEISARSRWRRVEDLSYARDGAQPARLLRVEPRHDDLPAREPGARRDRVDCQARWQARRYRL